MPVAVSSTGIALLAGYPGISGAPLNCRSWRSDAPAEMSSLLVAVFVQLTIQLLFGKTLKSHDASWFVVKYELHQQYFWTLPYSPSLFFGFTCNVSRR